jgi:Zn-finger nucleic acid-binding protein
MNERIINNVSNPKCPQCRKEFVDQGDYATVIQRRAICGQDFEGDFEEHVSSCTLCLKKQLDSERKITAEMSSRKRKAEDQLTRLGYEIDYYQRYIMNNIYRNRSLTIDEDMNAGAENNAGGAAETLEATESRDDTDEDVSVVELPFYSPVVDSAMWTRRM